MFSDGVLALDKAGALDLGHPVIASFAFGSAELYGWMDRNPRVRMLRTEATNDPAQIERRPHMVSVNSALQVDLFAEANASRVQGKIYSGFGGQTDFVVGALHSPGGLAVIALPSWHPKADVSTVVPRLTGPVTSFQHSFIVSEQARPRSGVTMPPGRPSRSSRRWRTRGSAASFARPGARSASGFRAG